ncbi:MAG TPA: hypothetical protein C5S51_03580 [Methanosarcinaceae archaeon]|nr:hypothetical protein [Methanosarcinaceae archaeon]
MTKDITKRQIRSALTTIILFLIISLTIVPIVTSAATPDIYVNQTGWWYDGGSFNASITPIQFAINNATAGNLIYVYNGSYTENVNVNKQLTLHGEGADVVNVTAALTSDHVFEVSVDYVNISGFNVTGATDADRAGFYLNGGQYCNISDNNVSGNYCGIYLRDTSNNNTLTSNNANSNSIGIYLRTTCNNNTLTSNNANLNSNHGICLATSSNNTLTNNTANSNTYGISLTSSSNNTLTNNTANSNTYGIYLYSSSNNNTLTDNNADSNTYGIYLRTTSNNNTLTNNTANTNTYGIHLRDTSNNNTLTNNNADSNTNYGIYLLSSSNNTLTNNNADSNTIRGISLESSSNNTLTNNNADSNSNGIYLLSSSNNTLTNNTANTNTNGIYLRLTSNNNTLTDNNADSNTNYGIFLYFSSKNTLTDNNADSNTIRGISLESSSNNTLTNNNADSNSNGICLLSSSNNTLTDNNADSNKISGIFLTSSSDNTLTSNNANSNTDYGIRLYSTSNNNTLTSNNANSNTLSGIFLQSSSNNNTLTSNNASSNIHRGIYLHTSSNNTLTSNNASNNTLSGIYLHTSSNNTLTSNNASNNTLSGIFLQYSSNDNTLTSNNANSNTDYGIRLYSTSNNNTLTSNNANSNTLSGIFLQSSSNNNTLTSNNVSNNIQRGIYLLSSSNNTIYNNYFSNTNNANDDGTNVWNTTPVTGINIIGGSWLGGNYWSNYAGADTNGDGLGDTWYNTSIANSGDYHPLVDTPPTITIFSPTVVARTDKAVYLLDPALWVTDASGYGVWPADGHPRNVTINAMVVDQYGRLVPNERYPDEPNVTYCVHNGSSGAPIICNGTMDKVRTGFYTKTIEVNETTGAGVDYLVHVDVTGLGNEVSGSTGFTVGRWGCDSCHFSSKHAWSAMLGNNTETGGSITFDNLINASLTHLTTHAEYDTHESLITRTDGGSYVCSDCHTGQNSVQCTQCHTSYMSGQHSNVAVGTTPATTCSNESCHGHLTTSSVPDNLDNRYPSCDAANCHPISYKDNFTITSLNHDLATVPQWLNNTTGARDLAVHPNPDNPIVNCSFCHNNFHNVYDEADTLTCDDCHNESIGYTLHNGTTTPASTAANCTDCHDFSGTHQIDIHNTITPSCSLCHDEVNHSSYDTDGVSCLQCHNDNMFNYSGNVLTNGTYLTSTSIHSMDNLIPECDDCHIGYNNHSSFDTYGVDCIYCHNNATLNYSGSILPANTIYNTGASIHTPNATEMKPGCTTCHNNKNNHTSYNTTGVICIQCHNNATLNYTGTKMYSAEYNTGTTVHTTNTTPASGSTLSPLCTTCHTKTGDEIETGYDNYAMNDNSNNLAPSGSNMTHKRDTITGNLFGDDPPDGNVRYARHANPDSSGGWPGATGTAREPNQVCINCHSDRIRYWGIVNENTWDDYQNEHCNPCHYIWHDTPKPDAHNLSIPYCSDCHGQLNDPDSYYHNNNPNCPICHAPMFDASDPYWHRTRNLLISPKDYSLTPSIGMMLNDSAHKRMILNTSTNHPTNYTGCMVCHTTVTFTANSTPDTLTINITDHSGAHTWNSKPSCTKCHSISESVERPGPYPYGHELLNIGWGNNTQCLKCHNIYNQTAGRDHGHDVTNRESCTGCHYNYQAMNDYGNPSVYVNETMYADSVHGIKPGANCTQCHTKDHPPPESGWKACECCHSYQSDPVDDTNRHNLTSTPSSSVVDITDCTVCHEATLYNTASTTFSSTAINNCRYCHTYPDKNREYFY